MLMIVCKNIYKTVVIKICASICNDKMTTNERFPSPMLCPCIHTHFITLVFVCRGRSIPVLPPSLSQSIPQLWCHQPSESLIYCLRLRFIKCGVKVGALQSFCACVCVRGRASSCAVGADLICPTCEALIQVWTGPERSGACLVCGKRLQSPTCMRRSWKTRVSGKVWHTSVCLFANRLICLAVTLNEAVLVCGLYKRFHHLEGYKVTAEKLTDYMSGGFCTMQGQFTLGRMSVARFFTHFFWAN